MDVILAGPGRAGLSLGAACVDAGHPVIGVLARDPEKAAADAARLDARALAWDDPLPAADLLVIAALCVLYQQSFVLTSPVDGPGELFQMDGPHIIASLARQERHPFNPQNHLLYHALVDGGYAPWSGVLPLRVWAPRSAP